MTEQRQQGPKTFQQAAQQVVETAAKAQRMTPEEAAQAERDAEEVLLDGEVPDQSPLGRAAAAPPEQEGGFPKWSRVPDNLAIPPHKQVGFMLFKAAWTGRPELGDRDIIFWNLSVADEKLAKQAARGGDALPELAKRMIRSIDGHKADWTGKKGLGSVDRLWEDIGGKCRPLIINAYWKTHSLEVEETAEFFLHCCTYRTAVGG